MTSTPLLAAGDWIGVVVFLVIMIISAISQIAGNKKEVLRPPAPRPRPPVRPPQAGGGQQGPIARELEEFLRRAGGQPQARPLQQPGSPPPQRPASPPQQRPPARPPTARPLPARPAIPQPAAPQEIDELEVIESVADHVSSSVGGLRSQLEHRADQPAGLAGDMNHRVRPASSGPVPAVPLAEPVAQAEIVESLPATAAAGLAAMLADPGSLRQAILINEILQRPEHRWT